MEAIALKSKLIEPGANLFTAIQESITAAAEKLKSGDIVVVSSKVVAICQNRIVSVTSENELKAVVKQEAEQYWPGEVVDLTLKYGILIPNAGIDQSNTKAGTAVLWPQDPQAAADQLRQQLKEFYQLQELGVVIIDSRCQPLRRGVTAVALAYSGFEGVEDKRGQADLYGRPLRVTQIALADQIANVANLVMGEADEAKPFAIIRLAPVVFTANPQNSIQAQKMPADECLFRPLFDY